MNCELLEIGEILIEFEKQDSRIAVKLCKQLHTSSTDFQKRIGHYPPLKTHLIICSDDDDYSSRINRTQDIMEFSQAFYSSRSRKIYIRNPRDGLNFKDLHKIILHEYIHHFVFYYFIDAPLWFQEGMAVYFSKDLSQSREINLAAQYFMKNTLPLREMDSYPDNRLEWEPFYAKSALAVRYLSNRDKEGFYNLWNKGETFQNAFRRSFYRNEAEFSLMFDNYLKQHFGSMIFMLAGSMVWMLFPFLFLISVIRRKIKEKKILQAMENEEREEKLHQKNIYMEIEIDSDEL